MKIPEFPVWADHLQEGVVLVDREGRILRENARAREIFSRGGTYLWERIRRQEIFEFLNALDEQDTVHLLLHRPSGVLEFRGVRDGTFRWVFILPRPDVVLRANQRHLFSQISHELRTPLSNIRMAYDLFARGEMDQDGFLQTVGRNLERMEILVDLLSRQHKLETWISTFEPGDWCREIESVLHAFGGRIQQEGLHLEFRCNLASPLPLDRFLLSTILFPLLDNAVRYNRPGGTIRVEVVKEEGRIRIRVEDTGRGIPASIRERVFDPFVQFQGGTGLGLSLVRVAVERWGGEIQLESEEGKGTRVTVRLPIPTPDMPGPS